MSRAATNRTVRLASGQTIEGPRLVRMLERLVTASKLLTRIERRGTPAEVARILLDAGVRDPAVFRDRDRLHEILHRVLEHAPDAFLEKDEEHGLFELVFQRKDNSGEREVRLGEDFVTTAEYRGLASSWEEFAELDRGPVTIVDGGETTVSGRNDLVARILAEGKKGLTISRYKGLGEMNAEELWETTMNPATRTLLQVRLEDDEVAENIFTTLMGDAVEPRRQFIEENALNVRYLDV
jgi:DNA gyrase subunit B